MTLSCETIWIEKSQGAYWSVFEDGDRRYRSTIPCNTPEAAARLGRIQALKAEAQQNSSPVVLVEGGFVFYTNLKARELGIQIGDPSPPKTKKMASKTAEGIDCLLVLVA